MALEPLEQRQMLSVAPLAGSLEIELSADEGVMVGRLDNMLTVDPGDVPEGSKLDAWIDLNGDGSYGGAWERIAQGIDVVDGENQIAVDVPANFRSGATFARFLISSEGGLAPGGGVDPAVDHPLTILPPAVGGAFAPGQVVNHHAEGGRDYAAMDSDNDGIWEILIATEIGAELFEVIEDEVSSDLPGGFDATAVFAADLDGDGTREAIIGSYSFGRIESPAGVIADQISWPSDVAAADMDGDGDIDVVTSAYIDHQIAWHENDGNGTYTPHVVDTVTAWPKFVVTADLDGDGDIDLISGHRPDGELDYTIFDSGLSWYENDGTGQFATHSFVPFAESFPEGHGGIGIKQVEAADLDGDGDVDLVVLGHESHRQVEIPEPGNRFGWLENDGNGNFTSHEWSDELVSRGWSKEIDAFALGDLDGDGDFDLLTNSAGWHMGWHANDGAGGFEASYVIGSGQRAFPVDADGDGDLDIVVGGSMTPIWYENLGTEPASQLGQTDFARLAWIADSEGNADLHFQTARGGLLTIELDVTLPAGDDFTPPELVMLDAAGNEVGQLTIDGTTLRIDHQTAAADEQFTLRLRGALGDMELTVCNLVGFVDGHLTVHDGESVFTVGEQYTVAVNDVAYQFDPSEIAAVTLQGDWAIVHGTEADESAVMSPDLTTFTYSALDLIVTSRARGCKFHGGGGRDVVTMYDSAEDDTFSFEGDTATLSGYGGRMATGFSQVQVYARAGGDDTAQIDMPDGRAKVHQKYTKAMGETFVRCKLFESVSVVADQAVVFGTEQADRFETWGNRLQAKYGRPPQPGYRIWPHDPMVPVVTPAGIQITDDIMPIISFDRNPYTQTVSLRANTLYLHAQSDPHDRLIMHDSIGDDVLIAKPHKVMMANAPDEDAGIERGDVYNVIARGFRNVIAIADAGGDDVAKLHDSAENGTDTWTANYRKDHTWSKMESPKRQLYEVWDFEQVGGYGFHYDDGDGSLNRNVKAHSAAVDFVYEQGQWVGGGFM